MISNIRMVRNAGIFQPSAVSAYFFIFLPRGPFIGLFPHQLTEPSPWIRSASASARLQGQELSLAELDQKSWSLAPITLMNTGSHQHSSQQKANLPFILVKMKERPQWCCPQKFFTAVFRRSHRKSWGGTSKPKGKTKFQEVYYAVVVYKIVENYVTV